MQMNKQGTQFYWNILLLHERHWYSWSRGLVASYQLTQPFSSRNPDNSSKALACFPFISYPQMHEQSNYDVTKWCQNHLLSHFSGKSTVHAQGYCQDLPAPAPAPLPTIFFHYARTLSCFPQPIFQACDTLPQVFWCTLVPEPQIYY